MNHAGGTGRTDRHVCQRGDYEISTDPRRLDLAAIHGYLSRSYWAAGVPVATVARAVRHSLCFGLYRGARSP